MSHKSRFTQKKENYPKGIYFRITPKLKRRESEHLKQCLYL